MLIICKSFLKCREVVSFNFWYPPPTWFQGDLAKGQITWDRRYKAQSASKQLLGHSSVLAACSFSAVSRPQKRETNRKTATGAGGTARRSL